MKQLNKYEEEVVRHSIKDVSVKVMSGYWHLVKKYNISFAEARDMIFDYAIKKYPKQINDALKQIDKLKTMK